MAGRGRFEILDRWKKSFDSWQRREDRKLRKPDPIEMANEFHRNKLFDEIRGKLDKSDPRSWFLDPDRQDPYYIHPDLEELFESDQTKFKQKFLADFIENALDFLSRMDSDIEKIFSLGDIVDMAYIYDLDTSNEYFILALEKTLSELVESGFLIMAVYEETNGNRHVFYGINPDQDEVND